MFGATMLWAPGPSGADRNGRWLGLVWQLGGTELTPSIALYSKHLQGAHIGDYIGGVF